MGDRSEGWDERERDRSRDRDDEDDLPAFIFDWKAYLLGGIVASLLFVGGFALGRWTAGG